MKRKDLKLSALSRVKGNNPRSCEGRLGLLLLDRQRQIVIAISAAQVVRPSDNLALDGFRVAQGTNSHQFANDQQYVRLAEMMLMEAVVGSYVKIDETPPSIFAEPTLKRSIVADAGEVLGESILIHSSLPPRRAYLRSTSGRFRMPCPVSLEQTLFTTALELAPHKDDGAPLTVDGDAGALVTTMSGIALGIVICGFGQVSFAAPLWNRLASLNFVEVLTAETVREYNARVVLRQGAAKSVLTPVKPKSDPAELRAATESDDRTRMREQGLLAADEFLGVL